MVFPLTALAYDLRVRGKERLDGVCGPVLFAANHSLHLDNPLIIKALPRPWRRRLAIAAAAHLWRNPFWATVNPLMGNGFPLSQQGAVRASLDNLGRLLDQGWSVLLYPEGVLSRGGPIQPFKSGIGLVAVDAGVPVVPLRLYVRSMGVPWQLPLARRGRVEVRFGHPLTFSPGADYTDAARSIEEAVRAL